MTSAVTPVAVIIVPTHDHASTLDLAVESALGQTVSDVEVVIIGDGVTPDVRDVATRLARIDGRVRFLDLAKAEHHGERYRDEVIRASATPLIAYLCDDDLLLPGHVEQLVDLLAEHDLAQSLNGWLEPDGRFVPYPSDLSSPAFREWLLHPRHNSVSVTGTGHTRAAYLRLAVGWEPPPPGRWTDHYLWQKFLRLDGIRAVTGTRVTAIQAPSHLGGRASWTPQQRRAELLGLRRMMDDPVARAGFDDRVRDGLNRTCALTRAEFDRYADDVATVVDDLRERHDALMAHALNADDTVLRLRAQLDALGVTPEA